MIEKPTIKRRTVPRDENKSNRGGARPGSGGPTREQTEIKHLLEKKTKLCQMMFSKAEELLMKGETNEGRQCVQSARELEHDIDELKRKLDRKSELRKQQQHHDDEPKEQEEEQTMDQWKKRTIFKPMEVDEETGEYKFIEWDELEENQ